MRLLNNEEIEAVCDMGSCVDALYRGLRAYSRGDAARRPRIDLLAPTSRAEEYASFSTMDGIIRGGYYALRIKPDILSWPIIDGMRRRLTYCCRPGLYGGLVLLFRAENAELVAIMNDGYVQHMRVGALAALGARYLSRERSATVGMLGSGHMARAYAMGFAAVRPIRTIKAYSPTPENLRAYCEEMTRKLQIEVLPQENAEAVIEGSDIVAACTNSMDPVIDGRWLAPGMYVANTTNWELDEDVFQRITVVGRLLSRSLLNASTLVDDNFELRMNVMAYVAGQPDERERIPTPRERQVVLSGAAWVPCVDWATETPLGRRSDEDICLLAELVPSTIPGAIASAGIQGLLFAAVAGSAYELAEAQGAGREMPIELFLQDIPT
jgi:ornithine cyclodeaminase/alanine dehydrogenase-like protein (mu-crystallin family)